ncbi:MAG: phosphoribosylamine--glycine ligase [Bacteroidales bacterium]|nr:phosphoribosylamine--glycine ligase [Bacteroidales bacterium]
MNILLLGSGGREHAIAYKLAQSNKCSRLFIAPGNAGTMQCGTNVDLNINDFDAVKEFVFKNDVALVVVGPEAPLVGGIVDSFKEDSRMRHVMVLGPSQQGAMLEGSKDFAKEFMARHNIPTAGYRTFTAETLQEGLDYLTTLKASYVLKADGLAAGKGVLILDNLKEAQQELREMLQEAKFGNASSRVVIEEFLSGIELSVFVLTDGTHYVMLPSAKDYKRVGEGDTGLNTGGMGSISPVPFADKEFMKKVEQRIVSPTIRGLSKEKIPYCGFLFVGLMNVEGDPYVIEYNVRMGDPETESVMPRIKTDLVQLFTQACEGTLNKNAIDIDNRTAACVMMVANGYPQQYLKGKTISGIEDVKDCLVFHCGTSVGPKGETLTNGGRVICVTALAEGLPQALLASYQNADLIKWDGKYMRRDIGQDLLKYLE